MIWNYQNVKRLPLFKVCGGASPSCRRNPLALGRGGSQLTKLHDYSDELRKENLQETMRILLCNQTIQKLNRIICNALIFICAVDNTAGFYKIRAAAAGNALA